MKKICITLLVLGLFVMGFAQDNDVDSLVKLGIELHDKGQFNDAVNEYEKALVISPNSSLVLYEMAYSYLSLNEYKKAIKLCKKVLKNASGHELAAYIVYGTALDMQGDASKSVKVYEEGMQNFDHYLLYYNHGVSCLGLNELDKAEESAIKGILNNPAHASGHLLLSNIMEAKGSRIKTVLPLYFFLLVEPGSSRSQNAFNTLVGNLNYGVSKTSETNINVNVPLNLADDSGFGAAEMMISLTKASNNIEENKSKTDMELFAENNESIFNILGELKKEKEGFWWDFYVPLFYDLSQNNFIESYSYYIAQSSEKEEVQSWMNENKEQLDKFIEWINNY